MQFLSKVISSNHLEPISKYLYHRADFAAALQKADATDQPSDLYTTLFSDAAELPAAETFPVIDTRLKAKAMLVSFVNLLQAIERLNIAIEGLDAVDARARSALDRLERHWLEADEALEPQPNTA
jgi:hypothetical protein